MSEDHSHRHHHVITLCVALIALLAACVLPFMMRDRLQLELRETSRALADEQKKIGTKIDSLNAAVDGLNSKAEPDTESIAELKRNVAETSTMIEVLGSRLDEMDKKATEKKPEPAPVATLIAPQPAPAALATPAPQANTFGALKLAILGGTAYASELAAWEKAQLPATKAPEALAAFAQSGIPNEAALMRDLRAALAGVAMPKAVDDVSLAGKINTHLAGLVKIKKTSAADPYDSLQRNLDRAELPTLMRDVEQLDEPTRAPFAPWLKTAKARAEALAALSTLEPKSGQ